MIGHNIVADDRPDDFSSSTTFTRRQSVLRLKIDVRVTWTFTTWPGRFLSLSRLPLFSSISSSSWYMRQLTTDAEVGPISIAGWNGQAVANLLQVKKSGATRHTIPGQRGKNSGIIVSGPIGYTVAWEA